MANVRNRYFRAGMTVGMVVGAIVLLLASRSDAQNMEHMSLGKAHYMGSCAGCHGLTGAGNGPQSAEMNPPPTNFTTATPATLPDNAIEQAILAGKGGTAMPSFATVFHGNDIQEIIAHIRSLSTVP